MKKGRMLAAAELLILVAYAFFAVITYRETEQVFTEDEMLLRNTDGDYFEGGG